MTGLLLLCFVGNSLNIDILCSSTKRSVFGNVKFGGRFFQATLLSRLSHNVCRRLSSPVLLRKFNLISLTILNQTFPGQTCDSVCTLYMPDPYILTSQV